MAAVLFAGSMMAQVTITPENSSWTSTAGAQTGTVEGVTVAVTNGVTGSTTAEGATMRIYKDATLTISSASNITKIVFNCVANNTTKYGPGCFGAQEGYSYDAKVGTWEGSATSVSFTASSAQVRATSIVVTLAEGGDTPVDPGDEPVAEWAEITFTKATAAGVFNDTVFTVEGSEFSLKCVDTDGKLKTTANNASFGTVEDRHDYAFRLQTGGKSSSKNNMELNIPADGQLRFAVRTATASDETRTVVLVQGTDTIYNKVAVDKDTVKGASDPRIFNFAYVNVKAGKVAVSYPVNGVNFYSFAFKAGAAEEPVLADTLTCAQAAELAAAGKTDEVIVKGYVTEIAYAWASGSMSFWMADTKDGGKVFEAYKCAIAKAEDAVIVGDLVAAKGKLTYYAKTSTPELAAGCTVEILEAVERPVVEPAQNLGAKTIAEFLELKNTKDTCILTGVVSNITNATYGNFDLIDKTDTIYVYGLLTPEGESKKFADLNVAEKDTLTVLAIYSEHNGKPQAKDAIFVEVKKAPKAPAQDIEITLSSLTDPGVLIWTDAVAEDGWWQIMGGSDAYQFSISNVSTTETAGVYTVTDLDPDYSYISIYGEKDTVDVAFENGSVTVAISNEGVVTVKGTLVGSDGNNYIFDLTYKDPVAEKTVNINITNAELNDLTEMYTMFGVAGEDADKNFVQFYFKSETIAGEYTEEDLNTQYTGIIVGEEVASIFSATIKVVANANGSYTVTATVLCYNNTLYNITMTVPSDTPEGVDAVNATVKALKSIVNGQLVIEKNGVQYNANGARIR